MRNANARKPFSLLLAGLALALFSGALFGQVLQIHYINVQQGQSTLIVGPNGTTILFDGGYETKGTTEVVPYLQSIGIPVTQTLNYIIASHRDTDHFAGLTEVINYGYDAYHVHDNGSDKTNVYVEAFLTAAATTTAGGVTALTPGTVIDLGFGASATCVAANGTVLGSGAVSGATANENDRAICLLIKYNGFDFLLNGDMGGGDDDIACTGRSTSQVNVESPTVYAIMPAGSSPFLSEYGVEVAHVGHHGSESSTNPDYMNILTPRVGCISVGAGQDASYMHPRVDVVEHVLLAGSPCITAPAALVLQTEEGAPIGVNTSVAGNSVGDIVITTDGINSYTVGADGAVSQGPDERIAAGLPATFYFEEYTAADNAPILYNIRSESVTAASADIAWCSNETATSVVRYGTASGIYSNTASNASLVLNHLLPLSALAPATTYYYVVDSTDATGHTTTSAEHNFLTTGGALGHVVISEVYYDTVGTDSVEEWFELYNNSGVTANVGGWTVRDNNGGGGTVTIAAGTTMAPGTYMTIAANSGGFTALYGYEADQYYGTVLALGNSGDVLVLRDNGGNTVDAVSWEGGFSGSFPVGWGSTTLPNAPWGYSIVRANVAVDTDTYADWTTAPNNGNPQTRPVTTNTVTVSAPNGGESWAAGSTHDITWSTTGTVGSLNIDYSTDNGSTWTAVVSGTANDGAYSWTVPNTPSANCRVRVQEADADPTDASDAVFTITAPAPTAAVVISEVYYDTIGTDAIEEWVELYNNTTSTVNLGGWTITDNYPAGGHVTLPAGLTIAPHSYLTVAANSGGFNALYGFDADYYYGTAIALGNSGDALLLRDGLNNLVDAVSYEGGLSGGQPAGWGSTTLPRASTGNSIYRSDVTVDTNTYADWTNTTDNSNGHPQTQLKVVISEVYYDTVGTDAIEEWIELYNNSGRIVDIGGCTITDNYPAGGHITIPAGTRMAPYSFLTVAANSGGFTNLYHYEADYYYGTAVALGNGGDALLLRDGLNNLVDAVSYEGGLSGGLPSGWGSTTLPRANTGYSIVRSDVTVDTDTYVDWTTAPNNGHPQTQRRYTLTIAAGTGGTTSPAAGTYTYDEGETVEISATAEAGYRFDGWSGDASGTDSPVSVLMNGDKTVTANFVRQYTLTVAAGTGGTTNPLPGTYTYDEGAVVAIEATATAGYRFLNWSGDASGTDNPLSVTMNGDMTVTANFIRQYTLTIVAGAGGTTDPAPGTYAYDEGAVVAVQAVAAVGYRFLSWSGDASGTANPVSVTMDGDKTVTASFIRQYTLTIIAGAGGTTNPRPGAYLYDEGTRVQVAAVAAAGYRFAGWSGFATGTASPISVAMSANRTVIASFVRGVELTITAGAGGTTNPAPGTYSYDIGAPVTIQAVPAAGFEFIAWSGHASGSANPLAVVMNNSKRIHASFGRVVKSPLGLSGEKLENRSVSMIEHIVRLRWQPNPGNAGAVAYRVYRIEGGQALAIAEVGAGTTEHVVHGVEGARSYLFGVTAVNGQGWESDMARVEIR